MSKQDHLDVTLQDEDESIYCRRYEQLHEPFLLLIVASMEMCKYAPSLFTDDINTSIFLPANTCSKVNWYARFILAN